MTNRVTVMNPAQPHPVCTAEAMSNCAIMYAACCFSVLRFYFSFSFTRQTT